MKERIFLKPGPGRRLKDPKTFDVVPPGGAWKPKTVFWLRRLRDGDAVIADPPGMVGDEDEISATVAPASTKHVEAKTTIKSKASKGRRGGVR